MNLVNIVILVILVKLVNLVILVSGDLMNLMNLVILATPIKSQNEKMWEVEAKTLFKPHVYRASRAQVWWLVIGDSDESGCSCETGNSG